MAMRAPKAKDVVMASVLAAAVAIPGCGYSPVGPIGPIRSLLDQREWALAPLEALTVDVRIPGSAGTGTVDATAEWTHASDDINLYVTATGCTPEMFAAQRCGFKARADGPTAKPERLSFDVSGGDSYRIWIVNAGPGRETGTFVANVVITYP